MSRGEAAGGFESTALAPGVLRWRAATPLTHRQFLLELCGDGTAPMQLSRMLAGAGFEALLWELPPLTRERIVLPFECVLTECRALARMPSHEQTFASHFSAGQPVAVFDNLGGDAVLVAPAPDGRDYRHLVAFCRNAPDGLQRLYWQRLAEAVLQRVGAEPLWASTSGLGVGWLHARLDTRPKYYSHAPYRRWPQPVSS